LQLHFGLNLHGFQFTKKKDKGFKNGNNYWSITLVSNGGRVNIWMDFKYVLDSKLTSMDLVR